MSSRPPAEVRIRPARIEDAEAMLVISEASIREFGADYYSPSQVDSWARTSEGVEPYEVSIRDDTRLVVIAERKHRARRDASHVRAASEPWERAASREDDRRERRTSRTGDAVGWGRLDKNDGEVSAVYVHPDYAREGVGSKILDHLEGVACEHDIDRVHLLASLNAVPFYEAAGYEALGETLQETSGGVIIECVEMEKELE
jgi:putative acetyltransferase